jgi:hypothetical protein
MQIKVTIMGNSTAVFLASLLLVLGCAEDPAGWGDAGPEETDDDTSFASGDTGSGGGHSQNTPGTDGDIPPEQLPPGSMVAEKGTISNIDGLLNEPVWNLSMKVVRTIEGVGNNQIDFGVLWDEAYLYIGVRVVDPNKHNDSYMIWQDDSIEVFVDGDHNKGIEYDVHDIQYWIEHESGALVGTFGMPLNAKHGIVTLESGYTAELAIPWEDVQVTPEPGMNVGFDLGINDDDDGDDRDAHYMWNGTDDNWMNTSAFGTLILK